MVKEHRPLQRDTAQDNIALKPLYDNVLLSLSKDAPVESLVEAGCEYLSKGGELLLVYVIEVPSQLPYMYADTQIGDAQDSLEKGMRLAERRNIKAVSIIISTRDFASAIIETAVKHKSMLILLGRRRTLAEKIFIPDISKKFRKNTGRAVILLNY